MNLRSAPLPDLQRQETAAEWVIRLQSPDLSESEASEWLEWCEADLRNRAAFEAMAELWEVSGALDRDRVAAPRRPAANDEYADSGRHVWIMGSAVASALALALVAIVWLVRPPATEELAQNQVVRLQTPLAVVRTATLADGSRVEVGGRSRLVVRYSAAQRTIVAEDGEAFFAVASNPQRPFVVEAGPVTVTAVGTAFSVQRDGNSVLVSVIEGTVEVRAESLTRPDAPPAALRASAGHRVLFDRGELTQSVEPAQADVVAPWRNGRLEFRDQPLRLVVARINRYSPRQLEISDPSIADLRVTTTVYSERIDDWLQGLSEVLPIRVTTSADKATIAPAT